MALWLAILAVASLGPACSSPRSSSASGATRPIERLDLLLTPMALDLDGRPGADGFGVRVYASGRRSAFGSPIGQGALEILMFDGTIRAEDLPLATPLRTWRYEAAELKPFAQKTSIGTGYRFALSWGEQKPRGERITVLARYVAPDKLTVTSAPGAIPLTLK